MTPASYSPATFAKPRAIVGSARPQPPRFVLRQRHGVGAFAFALALTALYLFVYEPPYNGTLVVRAPRPLIFAHGGFGDYAPDNSLYAVDRAFEAGMDGVEVKGQLTRDGELVIFHGASVDRLTSATGRVGDKTLKEMLALDLGPKYRADLHGAYVRTFEDFVRAVKGRGTVMVELQVPGLEPTGIEQRAVEIIERHDAHLSVVLGSRNPVVLYRVKRLDPLVRTAFIFRDTEGDPRVSSETGQDDQGNVPWVLRQEFIRRAIRKVVRIDLLGIHHQVDEAVIDRLIAKGWPALLWTPDTEAEIRHALARRPYAIISDQPLLARQLRGDE